MLDIYGTLEIEKVLKDISTYSHSEIGKEKLLSLRMFSSFNELNNELHITNEMISLIYRYSSLPIVNSFNLLKDVEIAKKFGILTPLDFEHIANDIKISNDIVNYFKKVTVKDFPLLLMLANKLNDLSFLEKKIHQVILPDLSISSNASEALKAIRYKIERLEKNIRETSFALANKYSKYLSDINPTFRNDHLVLAIKTSDKNKINGIIHDVSDSGQTTFIEPSELVELANELYVNKVKEKEEIRRILKELSEEVASSSSFILENNDIIARLDFLDAKASFAIDNKCYIASLEEEGIIDLKGARHPLLNKEKVVPNDFYLDKKGRIIIISGPNAGGKSVALKTLGINVMMNQMGLAIFTNSPARLSFFARIFADIGDNQSLADNLSTFAAHIANLSTITHFAKKNDLVLLDELGTGTSPSEGEALALAISDYLLSLGVFALISSHYERMKEYAFQKENVINAMMVFDGDNLLPTYKLQVGYPGRSYGLIMAKRYRLKESVIAKANNYLNKQKGRSVNDVLDKLNKIVRQNEAINEALKKDKYALEIKEKEYKFNVKALEKKKENLLSDVIKEKEDMLSKAREEITDILRIKSNPNASQKELLLERSRIDNLLNEEEEISVEKEDIELNDYVELKDLAIVGRVTSLKGDKVNVISIDGMNIKTTLDNLALTNEPPHKIYSTHNVDELIKEKMDVKLELNIIGKHIDEGIEEVASYLDTARLKHFHTVRIIHGMGSGALRKAVHAYLDKCDFIDDYHYASSFDGGSGATIVILK